MTWMHYAMVTCAALGVGASSITDPGLAPTAGVIGTIAQALVVVFGMLSPQVPTAVNVANKCKALLGARSK